MKSQYFNATVILIDCGASTDIPTGDPPSSYDKISTTIARYGFIDHPINMGQHCSPLLSMVAL